MDVGKSPFLKVASSENASAQHTRPQQASTGLTSLFGSLSEWPLSHGYEGPDPDEEHPPWLGMFWLLQ